MKKEDLFQGAIVLARKYAFKKRGRCKIIEVGRSHSIVQNQRGYKFVTEQKDLRPAKITPKSLMELGFKEEQTGCPSGRNAFCKQFVHEKWYIRITLKEDCSLWDSNMVFSSRKSERKSYIHEIQEIINQQK